jgi:Holliday junction resolvase RusA-like endonuclease
MLTLTLPWPDHDLSPNARILWQVKQSHIRVAREYAKFATYATETALQAFSGSMTVEYTFCPPNKAHRDLDNLIANMKSSLDGVMDGLQTNDNQIVSISAKWGDVVKGGAVDVVVKAFEKVNMSATEDEYSVFCEMCGARL